MRWIFESFKHSKQELNNSIIGNWNICVFFEGRYRFQTRVPLSLFSTLLLWMLSSIGWAFFIQTMGLEINLITPFVQASYFLRVHSWFMIFYVRKFTNVNQNVYDIRVALFQEIVLLSFPISKEIFPITLKTWCWKRNNIIIYNF